MKYIDHEGVCPKCYKGDHEQIVKHEGFRGCEVCWEKYAAANDLCRHDGNDADPALSGDCSECAPVVRGCW